MDQQTDQLTLGNRRSPGSRSGVFMSSLDEVRLKLLGESRGKLMEIPRGKESQQFSHVFTCFIAGIYLWLVVLAVPILKNDGVRQWEG